MEDMGTIFMNINTLNILSVDVSRDIRALIHNKNRLSMCLGLMGEDSPI